MLQRACCHLLQVSPVTGELPWRPIWGECLPKPVQRWLQTLCRKGSCGGKKHFGAFLRSSVRSVEKRGQQQALTAMLDSRCPLDDFFPMDALDDRNPWYSGGAWGILV